MRGLLNGHARTMPLIVNHAKRLARSSVLSCAFPFQFFCFSELFRFYPNDATIPNRRHGNHTKTAAQPDRRKLLRK
jgi:hypothetical protein